MLLTGKFLIEYLSCFFLRILIISLPWLSFIMLPAQGQHSNETTQKAYKLSALFLKTRIQT